MVWPHDEQQKSESKKNIFSIWLVRLSHDMAEHDVLFLTRSRDGRFITWPCRRNSRQLLPSQMLASQLRHQRPAGMADLLLMLPPHSRLSGTCGPHSGKHLSISASTATEAAAAAAERSNAVRRMMLLSLISDVDQRSVSQRASARQHGPDSLVNIYNYPMPVSSRLFRFYAHQNWHRNWSTQLAR